MRVSGASRGPSGMRLAKGRHGSKDMPLRLRGLEGLQAAKLQPFPKFRLGV